ncbi:hypothetical protein QSV08_07545 [Maribacter sp. BPC-D8]|uniref:hypothetical protein n=1 Tax=Maribacter sp. BPC-D8 TaxID=3053613 RepID=UPI002B49D8A6|nr:hypothetical protein [Maribacter sp. BPC-D8]WRI31097.1 hypothetical protein QSV08_07545 [Maribacter sp. BPC-D8]
MAVLESNTYSNIVEVGKKAVTALKNHDLEAFEKWAEQGWQLFPEPKENWNQGYNYAKMVFKGVFDNQKFESAKLWLNRMISNNNHLHNFDGECQFYEGKYLFETGEFEKALSNFKGVVKDAGLRYFEEDKKYLDFYKNPHKYIK